MRYRTMSAEKKAEMMRDLTNGFGLQGTADRHGVSRTIVNHVQKEMRELNGKVKNRRY